MAAQSRPRRVARPRRRRGPSIVAARSCPMGRTPSNASSAERASRSAASAPVASHSRDHVRRVPPRAAGHDQPELWHGRRYVRRSLGAGSGRLEDGDHRCVVAGPPRAVIHDRPARGDPQPPVHDYVVVLPWLRAVTVRVGAHVSAAGRVRADAVRGGHLVWRDRPRVGQAERGEPFQHVAVPLAVGRVQLVEMLRSPASTSGRGERTRPRRSISGVRGRDRRMPPGSRPTVERAVRNLDARRWLGLTATPQRPDGLKDIMVMQCGPIRHRITRSASDLDRQLQIHRTELTIRYRYPVATVIRWRDPAFCRVRLEGLSQRFACCRWLTSMADKISCLSCS